MQAPDIIAPDDPVLITGAAGFIGPHVVRLLLRRGLRHLRCFVRPSAETARLDDLIRQHRDAAQIELFVGDLQSPADCRAAAQNIAVVYHLAAARGEKSYAEAFRNSVVTTRNLLEALLHHGTVRRVVNVSSLSVYANTTRLPGSVLDETCPVEPHPELRGDAYTFAKVRQDQLLRGYGARYGLPYVLLRPGFVYGVGNEAIPGRVGLSLMGLFLHLGGSNPLPLTYVDNCADAIALAGLCTGVDNEIFNVVDDDLPTSHAFLKVYQRNVKRLPVVRIPPRLGYVFCFLWEWYSRRSHEQIPPVFNRRMWHVYWKYTRYTNARLKQRTGWAPHVSTSAGLMRYFASCRMLAQQGR